MKSPAVQLKSMKFKAAAVAIVFIFSVLGYVLFQHFTSSAPVANHLLANGPPNFPGFIGTGITCNSTGLYLRLISEGDYYILNATMINESGLATLVSCGNAQGTGACRGSGNVSNGETFLFNFSDPDVAICTTGSFFHANMNIWYSYKNGNSTIITKSPGPFKAWRSACKPTDQFFLLYRKPLM